MLAVRPIRVKWARGRAATAAAPLDRAPMPEPSLDDLMAACQRALDYTFRDPGILKSALTHASGADHRLGSNERLEFLGDAILGAIVCEHLYRSFPASEEGELTRIKSEVVSRRTCAKLSVQLGFEEFLVLGKGIGSQGPTPASVLSDVFESLVGAIYLDGGFEAARKFVVRHVGPEVEAAVVGSSGTNHKSALQQAAQRRYNATPVYDVVAEEGPDHAKRFQVAARVGSTLFPPAWGPTKKDAEQRAAQNALAGFGADSPSAT